MPPQQAWTGQGRVFPSLTCFTSWLTDLIPGPELMISCQRQLPNMEGTQERAPWDPGGKAACVCCCFDSWGSERDWQTMGNETFEWLQKIPWEIPPVVFMCDGCDKESAGLSISRVPEQTTMAFQDSNPWEQLSRPQKASLSVQGRSDRMHQVGHELQWLVWGMTHIGSGPLNLLLLRQIYLNCPSGFPWPREPGGW